VGGDDPRRNEAHPFGVDRQQDRPIVGSILG
jgi:hypothetical protein